MSYQIILYMKLILCQHLPLPTYTNESCIAKHSNEDTEVTIVSKMSNRDTDVIVVNTI